MEDPEWMCVDCGKACDKDPKDYYMVTFELWDKIGVGKKMLCIEINDILVCPLTLSNPYTFEILKSYYK